MSQAFIIYMSKYYVSKDETRGNLIFILGKYNFRQ